MKEAVEWALTQLGEHYSNHELVDKVRERFNELKIEYETFSFEDLKPYLKVQQ